MNNELENTANEALRAIIDNAAAAKDFILAELPEVVQQLLMWKVAESLIWCIMGIIYAGIFLTIFIKGWRYIVKAFKDGSFEHGGYLCENNLEPVPWIITVSSLFPLAFSPLFFDLAWLQIWIAPKVYLLEYAAKLL